MVKDRPLIYNRIFIIITCRVSMLIRVVQVTWVRGRWARRAGPSRCWCWLRWRCTAAGDTNRSWTHCCGRSTSESCTFQTLKNNASPTNWVGKLNLISRYTKVQFKKYSIFIYYNIFNNFNFSNIFRTDSEDFQFFSV